MSTVPELTWSDPGTPQRLVDRVSVLRDRSSRVLLGITGPPGAGKSTITAALAALLDRQWPGEVASVPMDGFHLAHTVIAARGQEAIKGAPETFDADGYVAILERLRTAGPAAVLAPEFRREIEDPIAGAIPVDPGVRIVLTEGNYLLLDHTPWSRVRELLHEIWFVDLAPELRRSRLIERHRFFGADPEAARERAYGSDERNAALVAGGRARADLVLAYA